MNKKKKNIQPWDTIDFNKKWHGSSHKYLPRLPLPPLGYFELCEENRKNTEDEIKFSTPTNKDVIRKGGIVCQCLCKSEVLPRNAILLRPIDWKDGGEIYSYIVYLWKHGFFWKSGVRHGSCQQFIKTSYLKEELRRYVELGRIAISCIDNIDNEGLRTGDILITRHGAKKSIGRPYLIH